MFRCAKSLQAAVLLVGCQRLLQLFGAPTPAPFDQCELSGIHPPPRTTSNAALPSGLASVLSFVVVSLIEVRGRGGFVTENGVIAMGVEQGSLADYKLPPSSPALKSEFQGWLWALGSAQAFQGEFRQGNNEEPLPHSPNSAPEQGRVPAVLQHQDSSIGAIPPGPASLEKATSHKLFSRIL